MKLLAVLAMLAASAFSQESKPAPVLEHAAKLTAGETSQVIFAARRPSLLTFHITADTPVTVSCLTAEDESKKRKLANKDTGTDFELVCVATPGGMLEITDARDRNAASLMALGSAVGRYDMTIAALRKNTVAVSAFRIK